MAQDKISIASGACVLLGADEIQDFEEDTTEAQAARHFYEDVYETLLSERNWKFATTKIVLQQQQKVSEFGYKYVYRLSVDAIKLITIESAEAPYRLVSTREIHTDAKGATADILFKPDESVLPKDFTLALKYMLAAVFAPTVTDDSSQAARYREEAAILLKKAANKDAVQGPLKYRRESQFINAHRGGRFY